MDQHSSVQWVPITINLLVHIFMYYVSSSSSRNTRTLVELIPTPTAPSTQYYMLSALRINVWWKKYLTQLQILQFVIDIIACEFFIFTAPCWGRWVYRVDDVLVLLRSPEEWHPPFWAIQVAYDNTIATRFICKLAWTCSFGTRPQSLLSQRYLLQRYTSWSYFWRRNNI